MLRQRSLNRWHTGGAEVFVATAMSNIISANASATMGLRILRFALEHATCNAGFAGIAAGASGDQFTGNSLFSVKKDRIARAGRAGETSSARPFPFAYHLHSRSNSR